MTERKSSAKFRPMNVQVKPGSYAEKYYYYQAALPDSDEAIPEAIAPGLQPSPSHDLIFHGGKTIPKMTYTNFFVGGSTSWSQSDVKNIDTALFAAMSDSKLNEIIAQYFNGKQISCSFTASRFLPGQPPAVVSQGDVEALVRDLEGRGQLNGFDLSSAIFNFMLPSGTILNTSTSRSANASTDRQHEPEHEADSTHGLGGYHGSIHINKPGGKITVYYSVGVFSEIQAGGKENGIAVFDKSWKNVVATFYHELNEFRTDPDVEDAIRVGNDPAGAKFLGWTSQQGEEIGDFPVFEADPLTKVFREIDLANGTGKVPVQFQYSNRSHGPEDPAA